MNFPGTEREQKSRNPALRHNSVALQSEGHAIHTKTDTFGRCVLERIDLYSTNVIQDSWSSVPKPAIWYNFICMSTSLENLVFVLQLN